MQISLKVALADEADKILILVFDIVVFVLTIHKTWYQVVQARSAMVKMSYSPLLLRDGQ